MAELLHQWQELASLTATLSKAHRLSSSSAHTVGMLMGYGTQSCFGAMHSFMRQELAGEQNPLKNRYVLLVHDI